MWPKKRKHCFASISFASMKLYQNWPTASAAKGWCSTSAELRRTLDQLGRAIERLKEALAEPPTNPLALDGTIQRFEFTIELFWKSMKRRLAIEGVETGTPREALRGAFAAGWIDDETLWLDMLRARNETSHAYNEALARAIRDRVRGYIGAMERALASLRDDSRF
jgi:nucleotidyltransferase substrate binding protein (TIGR01987 family)